MVGKFNAVACLNSLGPFDALSYDKDFVQDSIGICLFNVHIYLVCFRPGLKLEV